MKNKEKRKVPPVANYLGSSLKDHGLETFNDDGTSINTLELAKIKENTNNPIIPDLSDTDETIVSVDPKNCRPWEFADRIEQEMGDIEELGHSISRYGQQEPSLVRPIKEETEGAEEYEIIFGRRRWAACLQFGLNLKVIIKNLSNKEAAIAQKEENEHRKDISNYSRAVYYKKLLNQKIFGSTAELSEKMGISKTSLIDLLSFTRINKKILSAMPAPHKLSISAASKLATISAYASDKQIQILEKLAVDIQNGKIPYRKIESRLKIIQGTSEVDVNLNNEKIYKNKSGKVLFSAKYEKKGSLIIKIEAQAFKQLKKSELEDLIKKQIEKGLNNVKDK